MVRTNTTQTVTPFVAPMLAGLVGGAKKAASSAETREAEVKKRFEEQFGAMAQNEAGFHALMKEVYGADYDRAKAEDFRQRALKGDYSWLPKVQFVESHELGGANGAYDKESGTVFLNKSLDNETLAATFLEEVGHHLDTKLKKTDTAGDE